jgi:hypothetical protein
VLFSKLTRQTPVKSGCTVSVNGEIPPALLLMGMAPNGGPVTTSWVFEGAPGTSAGFELVATVIPPFMVPEPSTLVLMIAPLLIAFRLARKRSATSA